MLVHVSVHLRWPFSHWGQIAILGECTFSENAILTPISGAISFIAACLQKKVEQRMSCHDLMTHPFVARGGSAHSSEGIKHLLGPHTAFMNSIADVECHVMQTSGTGF